MKTNTGVLLVLFVLSLAVCFAYPKHPEIQSPAGSNYVWDDTNKVWRPMAGSALGVPEAGAVSVTIGSTTINADPVWADESGSGTLALVDSSRRPIIVPGAYTTASYTNITLTPNVAYSIPLMTGVDSLTIQNTATSGEFWTGLKTATVSISTGLKAFSLVELEHVDLTTVSIIASTALPIAIIQLGY